MTNEITITRPDDMHLHLRDGAALASVVGTSASQFARAIVMPNLKPSVTSVELALSYRKRILDCLPEPKKFNPLMTLYLTDNTSPDEIALLAKNEYVHAVKYYPAGATTNSDQGVTSIERVYPVIEKMADLDVPLLSHGEISDAEVDIFDREEIFIDSVLIPLMGRYPELKIVFEHITTEQAVQFIEQGPETIAATITPQHLMFNRNALLVGGIKSHNYCLPVLKREKHHLALVTAATSSHTRFFLGTDSAPHERKTKENACGCAGIYSAPAAIEFYTEVFERADALDKLEAFASFNGADFYRLPRNEEKIIIRKQSWQIPGTVSFADGSCIPLKAGETCSWKIVGP